MLSKEEFISTASRFTAEYIYNGFKRKEAAELWKPLQQHYEELTKNILDTKPDEIPRVETGMAWEIYGSLTRSPHKFLPIEADCYMTIFDYFSAIVDDEWFHDGYEGLFDFDSDESEK